MELLAHGGPGYPWAASSFALYYMYVLQLQNISIHKLQIGNLLRCAVWYQNQAAQLGDQITPERRLHGCGL